MKILPLVKASDIQVTWKYHRHFSGDPVQVLSNFSYTNCLAVSPYELDHRSSVRQHCEEVGRAAVLRHIYPKELILELREIQYELAMRSRPRGLYGHDEFADLRERLAVVTAQLSETK